MAYGICQPESKRSLPSKSMKDVFQQVGMEEPVCVLDFDITAMTGRRPVDGSIT